MQAKQGKNLMAHARNWILSHMTNSSFEIFLYFYCFCGIRGLFYLTSGFPHKAKRAQCGTAYFKVEKVISYLLLRPCVEKAKLELTEV